MESRIGISALTAALQYENVEIAFGAACRLALPKGLTRIAMKELAKIAAQGGKVLWAKEAAAWVLAEQHAKSGSANLCIGRSLQNKRQKTASRAVRMLG